MHELLERLKELAACEANCDREDFMVNDDAGGNMDDAYQIGYDDGQIHLAKSLLSLLEEK